MLLFYFIRERENILKLKGKISLVELLTSHHLEFQSVSCYLVLYIHLRIIKQHKQTKLNEQTEEQMHMEIYPRTSKLLCT